MSSIAETSLQWLIIILAQSGAINLTFTYHSKTLSFFRCHKNKVDFGYNLYLLFLG